MAEYPAYEYDVLVIGAGGAGLRAAIEASAAGGSVGVVSKSLLGKAHTVMAEGGIAAAMGNVDERDDWKAHFADTMRGGQYVNNWRMAELHAKEAPECIRELEAWGALFDRTEEGSTTCLGLVPGEVKRLPPGLKVPHMGWNSVRRSGDSPLFRRIPPEALFYFVHSYYPVPTEPTVVAGETEYGLSFCSALQRGSLVATQFHPEKSGAWGLQLYDNFFRRRD